MSVFSFPLRASNHVLIEVMEGSKTDKRQHPVRCVDAFSRSECREFAAEQKINGTFIDVLADHGYEITLWGKASPNALNTRTKCTSNCAQTQLRSCYKLSPRCGTRFALQSSQVHAGAGLDRFSHKILFPNYWGR